MENKAYALMAGVFTLVLSMAAIALGLWFNRDREERIPYEMATQLSVPGLSPQAMVRYRGLDVGKVDAITFDPKVTGQILVHISVRPDTPMTQSTYGTLGYQGVTGIAYVQLDDDGSHPVRVPSSRGHVARIEMRPSLLDDLQNRGLAILEQTEEVTRRVNTLLAADNQKAILDTFNQVGKAATGVEGIAHQLQPTLARLPDLGRQAGQTLSALQDLAHDAQTVTTHLNTIATKLDAPDGALNQLSNTLGQVGAAAERIEQEMLPLTHDVRSSLRALEGTLDGIRAQPQSLLFGRPTPPPGPGERGFVSSEK